MAADDFKRIRPGTRRPLVSDTSRDQPASPQSSMSTSLSSRPARGQEPGTSWHDPYSALRRLSDEMHRWFSSAQFGRPAFSASAPAHLGGWSPQIEALQRGDRFIVRADLPGLRKEDVSIEVAEGTLTLEGERHQEREEDHEGYWTSERSYGHFLRVIPLPEGAIAESTTASFRDGVLEIVIDAPPREVSRGRRIEIRD